MGGREERPGHPPRCPETASAAARFTVTKDLPTPPLPLTTAYTRASEEGIANGIPGSQRPPRSSPRTRTSANGLTAVTGSRPLHVDYGNLLRCSGNRQSRSVIGYRMGPSRAATSWSATCVGHYAMDIHAELDAL